MAERYGATPDSALASELFAAERGLFGAPPLARPRPRLPRRHARLTARTGASRTCPADGQIPASVHIAAAGLAGVAHLAAVLDEPQREQSPTPRAGPSRRDRVSIFTGSFSLVSLSRCDSRVTCVSTGRPGSPNQTERTTLPVLRPTPGSVTKSASSVGISPSKRASTACAIPMRFFVFERKKPGRVDELLDLVRDRRRRDPRASDTGRTAPASPC